MGNKPATTTTNTTQNTSKNPWEPTIGGLNDIIGGVNGLQSDQFKTLYSDQTKNGVQGLTDIANGPNANGSYQALQNIVGGSGAGFGAGLGQLTNVANGGMIGANPHFDGIVDRAATDTANKVNSMFTAGGRYGSGAHAGTLGREVGNTVGNMRNANYQSERAAQDNAARSLYGGGFQGAGMSGAMDQAQLRPSLLSLQAGGLQDQMLNTDRTADMNALQWKAGMLNPIANLGGTSNSNGTQTQQTKQPTNWLTTGMGIAGMGLGALTGNPMMMASSLGGLFGGLGGSGTRNSPGNYLSDGSANDVGGTYHY